MERIGVVGLGNMGLGLARNLALAGFSTHGYDVRPERLALLEEAGGHAHRTSAEVGSHCEAVFVMVLNGDQVRTAVLGANGLCDGMRPGGAVIVTATVPPSDVRDLAAPLSRRGLDLIDSPVSGGRAGAEAGTLTLMVAAEGSILERCRAPLEAISHAIFHIGERPGQGQTVKAALQALIGCTFAATFEALVLGCKAGIKGETLFEVFRSSAVGSPLLETCARHVLEREFRDTGSHIETMFKDLGISMRVAREAGTAMFTTSAAYELFQAGIARFPGEDNWAVAKLLEEIAGAPAAW